MIKVLFLIEKLSGGGAEKVLRNLVNNMDQSKFDITVQTINREEDTEFLVPGVHYKAVNPYRAGIGKKLFSYWFRLCAELKMAYSFFVKGDYDIEIAYLETLPTKIIAQSSNSKAVKLAWVHCDLSKKNGIVSAVEKMKNQYQVFDKIICVSRDVKQGFCKLFGDTFNLVVLQNVIDEDEIFSKAEEVIEWNCIPKEKKMLAVGRLDQQKNFAHLIDTCAKLRDDGKQFHLIVLGEGPERSNLEEQIKRLKLENNVTLKGFQKNPYPYFKSADMLAASSIYEGISTVVQEALILGVPVVTTPCTGMEELLGKSEFGIIAEDTPDGLYDSLSAILNSDSLLSEYTEKARLHGESFSKNRTVKETEVLFQNLVADAVGGKNS